MSIFFNADCDRWLKRIYLKKHKSEKSGLSMLEVITRNKNQTFILKRSLEQYVNLLM